ncbi:hypothetical protein OKA04_23040 [Luteolibacter flavescens]|uniref:Nuclear transport factor 2 family protein n=1 Tax=Luteolibacter flavescens TaxID=1859460 RepID=A0ABT3FW52_9BACT|nr:hypothetical protein [Luteolibacter flavescens]MCW1887632.1 hypothetical protein [Luteolibacter flavescens]
MKLLTIAIHALLNILNDVMNLLRFALLALTSLALLSSCASSSRPTSAAAVPTAATITVTCKRSDHLGFREEIEHLLVNRGYNVVSDDVARRSVVTEFGVSHQPSRTTGRIESFSEKQLRSVYALSFTYTTYLDGQMKTLQGSVVDLNSGRVVRSIKVDRFGWAFFNGYDSYLEDFVNQL